MKGFQLLYKLTTLVTHTLYEQFRNVYVLIRSLVLVLVLVLFPCSCKCIYFLTRGKKKKETFAELAIKLNFMQSLGRKVPFHIACKNHYIQ